MKNEIERLVSFVESADDSVMYLIFVSLISSDSIRCLEDCKKSMEMCNDLRVAIESASIDEEKKKIYLGYITKSIDIINKDIEHYTNENNE